MTPARLSATRDQYYATANIYDASGNRAWKLGGEVNWMWNNGQGYQAYGDLNLRTWYQSDLVTITDQAMTKHYFIAGQRIASKLAESLEPEVVQSLKDKPVTPLSGDIRDLGEGTAARIARDFDCVGLDYNAFYPGEVRLEALETLLNAPEQPAEYQVFFYHSDHLGSSSFITDINGDATQHLQYLPFGEDLVHEQNTAAYLSPYTFSGKERDVETSLSYFGARYYEAGLSVWLSVDAKAHAFPSVSPYTFNMNNPVMFIDPDGDSTFVVNLGNSRYQVVGAEVKSGNRGIFEVCFNADGNRELTGNVIGVSFTTHSFVDESDNAVEGAVIDLKSTEAKDIVRTIHKNVPSTANYVTNWQKYNYKGNNNTKVEKYRGVQMPNGEIASMRDVGNYVAGYTFGYNGWPLSFARVGFERLQATKNLTNLSNIFGNGTESRNSVLAQNRGWLAGYKAQLSRRTGRNYD